MDNQGYIEWLVTKKVSGKINFLKNLLVVLAICFAFFGFMMWIIMFIPAIVCGVAAYFCSLNCNVEYEYLYCEKELSVDKITNKSKRKNVGKFEVDRMEILAPVTSYHLDDYKNKTYKNIDLSSGASSNPDTRYVFYYDGRARVTIEYNADIIKEIRGCAPRKVFND